jgi:uroporphyrinogen-III decarboxylase
MREALNNLADAGLEMLKVKSRLGQFVHKVISTHGFSLVAGGGAKAPFDVIADTIRGSRNMMMDMYRDSDKILQTVERLIPLQIRKGVSGANASGNPLVFMPLHKGADGFMSDEQFATMYWPSFKAVMLGLIEEGCIPFLFAEGGFNSRLQYLKELPKGRTLWHFDQTDMAAAKKEIGGTICMAGNVPSGMMVTGTADQVEECCRRLIDDCAPGGGYILTTGAIIDEGKADTMHALLNAAGRYGSYN